MNMNTIASRSNYPSYRKSPYPNLSNYNRSLIEFTLQLKPYFTVLHKILIRDLQLDPDSLKDKVMFKVVFNALDSSEFY